jgi:AcrR family transcriptional regulator
MPYPAQTDREIIVQTARELIEKEGIEQLSLAQLAATVGIKAPSLYRHIQNKAALIQAVNFLTFQQLFAAYEQALEAAAAEPKARLLALFRAHRAFAQANPVTYMLAFTTTEPREDENLLEQMVLPVQALMAALSGEARSLAALRGALALLHGFVMLELNKQFRRGGDLDEAFEQAIKAYVAGWKAEKDEG